MSPFGRAVTVAAALAVVLLLTLARYRGPAPKPADAPPGEFSAGRALEVLRSTIGTKPHPVGSAEHDAVRDRILSRLDSLGYETRVQKTLACNPHAICANVQNIIARLPGEQSSGPIVLLVAHYDSVPAGPGASDDGAGVAALLEIARIIRTAQFRNPVRLMIDDAEEAGLIGAEGFVSDGMAKSVGAIVNLEARGTSGPSFLFETSRNNGWFIPTVARALPRPVTSSLLYSIYDLLPNDTDLTVFKRVGLTGVNFGYIRDVANYHTPNDDIAHLDPRSLQHHGENALAAARAFANMDLSPPHDDGNATWFDVLGFFVVSWPASITLLLAIVSTLTALVAAAILVREDEATVNEIFLGIAFVLGSIVLGAALGLVLGHLRAKWVPHPLPSIAAMWIAGVVAALFLNTLVRRRARFAPSIAGVAVAWNLLAIFVTVALNGASFLFVVPAIVLTIGAILRSFGIADDFVATTVAAVVTAILWFPLATTIYDALGAPALIVTAIILALVTTTFAPLFERTRLLGAAAAVAVVLAIVGMLLPAATAPVPSRNALSYVDDGTSTRWIAAAAVPGAQFSPATVWPWNARPARVQAAPAPRLPIAPVAVAKLSDVEHGKRTLTLRVASQRAANRVTLIFHTRATIDGVRINGVPPPPRSARFHEYLAPEWHSVSVRGAEMTVQITTRGRLPIDAVAIDTTYGLPPEAAPLARARTAANGITTDDGDTTVTLRRVSL